jgi:hypothetical protein
MAERQDQGQAKGQAEGQGKFQEVRIAKGQTESEEIAMVPDAVNAPRGQVRSATGQKMVGQQAVEFTVQPSGQGSKIVLAQPAPEDLTIRVKEGGEDDDDEGDEPQGQQQRR